MELLGRCVRIPLFLFGGHFHCRHSLVLGEMGGGARGWVGELSSYCARARVWVWVSPREGGACSGWRAFLPVSQLGAPLTPSLGGDPR
jgi:hypothetical protein